VGDVTTTTRIVPVEADGTTILVEATILDNELLENGDDGDEHEDLIAGVSFSLDGVQAAIREISRMLSESLNELRPNKVQAEFGCEIAAEPGGLTALLVKGSGKASIKLTLEWAPQATQ
jgi:hypothetical protein